MAPHTSRALLLFFGLCAVSLGSEPQLPKGMHRDNYCIGCELTMKVIERALMDVDKNHLSSSITKALTNVCKPDHFDIAEYSKSTMSDACKYLIGEHRVGIEKALMERYSKGHRPSYLDLVQQVCLNLTDACHGIQHDDHDHDPLKDDARLKLDRETNEFVVLPGKNLKVAKPVLEIRDEL